MHSTLGGALSNKQNIHSSLSLLKFLFSYFSLDFPFYWSQIMQQMKSDICETSHTHDLDYVL